MHKLIKAYQSFNQNLVTRKILAELPEMDKKYSTTYDSLEGEDVWRLHINAGEMSLVAHIDENGDVEAYLPFKQCTMAYFLSANTAQAKLSYGMYCDRVHPLIESILEQEDNA